MVVPYQLQSLRLLLLNFHQCLFLVLQCLKLFLEIFQFILLALNAPAIIHVFQLSFDDEDFVFEGEDFGLLFFELLFFGLQDFVFFLICVDAVFFGFFFASHDFVHLFGQFVDLGFEFDVLFYHFLSVGVG